MSRLVVGFIALILCCFATVAQAENWTQFRGTKGDGVAPGGSLPTEWDGTKNIQWTAKLPGYGWSSPVVWGDKVFVTTAVSDKQKKPSNGAGGFGKGGGFNKNPQPPDMVYQWQVHCLSAADGKVLWKQTAAERGPTIPIHG
ncbi:MAG: PQQ-binding-like beta-propeller repeat protein, partial [Planctomycetia bacterium]|nr:PQQ-binding-like beta-propeller repeat protein [Planctomycetia bacterium]